MKKSRTIYKIGDALFIYKKNANSEKKANGGDIENSDCSPENFEEIFYSFSDCKDFEKKNPTYFSAEDTHILEIDQKMPSEEFIPGPSAELKELTATVAQLQQHLNEMQIVNENLRKGKIKLSFEDAEKLYAKKSELLRGINRYNMVKEQFVKLEIEQSESDILESEGITLILQAKSGGYREESLLKTSSMLIISEFVLFIIKKLNDKVEILKQEVETIDFA